MFSGDGLEEAELGTVAAPLDMDEEPAAAAAPPPPPPAAVPPVPVSAKRARNPMSECEDVMADLQLHLGAAKVGNTMIMRHRVHEIDPPTSVGACCTPEFYLVFAQQEIDEKHSTWLEAHHFVDDDTGITITSVVRLENSDGLFTLSTLPSFDYAPYQPADPDRYVAMLDNLGRYLIWDAITGLSVLGERRCVSYFKEDKTELAFVDHSAFAITNLYMIVMRAETTETATVLIRRWRATPEFAEYGEVDDTWDQFLVASGMPGRIGSAADNPFEFLVYTATGAGRLNALVPAPFRAVVWSTPWTKAVHRYETLGSEEPFDFTDQDAFIGSYVAGLSTYSSKAFRDDIARVVGTEFDVVSDGQLVPIEGATLTDAGKELYGHHNTTVMGLRQLLLPALPAEHYACHHVHVTSDIVVATFNNRVVWTHRPTNAHSVVTDSSVQGALGSVALGSSDVATIADADMLVVSEMPMPLKDQNTSSTTLMVEHGSKIEAKPTMVPIVHADGTTTGGAPMTHMIAVTPGGRCIASTFSEYIFVHSLTTSLLPPSQVKSVLANVLEDVDVPIVASEPTIPSPAKVRRDAHERHTHGMSVLDAMTPRGPSSLDVYTEPTDDDCDYDDWDVEDIIREMHKHDSEPAAAPAPDEDPAALMM